MTVRLSGNYFSDGEIFYAADANDTIGAIQPRKYTFTNGSEYLISGGVFKVVSGLSFNLSGASTGLVTNVVCNFWMHHVDSAQTASTQLQISGANLGVKYLIVKQRYDGNNDNDSYMTQFSSTAATYAAVTSDSYIELQAESEPFAMLDDTINFTFKLASSNANAGYISGLSAKIYYVKNYWSDN